MSKLKTNAYSVGDNLNFAKTGVITQETGAGTPSNHYEWIATFPGFQGHGSTESDALGDLSKRMEYAAERVRSLRIGRTPLDRAVNSADSARFKVGDRLELTCDCELGEGDTIFVVKHVEGSYMTIQLESDPESRIHTGRDYKFLQLAGQPWCKHCGCDQEEHKGSTTHTFEASS